MTGHPDVFGDDGTRWTWVPLSTAGFGAYVIAEPDVALDAALEQGAPDAPYHGLVWPSGRALARQILARTLEVDGRVCDLGCGVGVVGLAAARVGAHVTFVDRAHDAFVAVCAAAFALDLDPPPCVQADWARDDVSATFDYVLAADVLYDPAAAQPLVQWARRHLVPGGELWVADPGRAGAATLDAHAADAGLTAREACAPVLDPASGASIAISRYRAPSA